MWNPFRAIGDFVGRVVDRVVDTVRDVFTPGHVPEPVPTPEPIPVSTPDAVLPQFDEPGSSSSVARDDALLGADSPISYALDEAVADFISNRGGLDGLSFDACEWLGSPTISSIFDEYWKSGGFTGDQVLAGMHAVSNIKITETEDGDIEVEFDYDADVGDYVVSGHAS